jgi:acetyl-CoA carboxylase carboxyl transferase subunit alpha
LKLIDSIIPEPLGGAHRNFDQIADSLKQNLLETLVSLELVSIDKLLEQRYQKLMAFGEYREG